MNGGPWLVFPAYHQRPETQRGRSANAVDLNEATCLRLALAITEVFPEFRRP